MAKEEEVALGDADVHPAAFPVPAEKYGEVSPLAHSVVKGLIPYRRRITSRVVNLQSETVDLVVQNWRRVVDRLDDAAWNAGQALKRGQAGTFLIPNPVDGWTSVAAAIACERKNDEDLRSGDTSISRRDCVTRWFVSQMKGNTTRFATKRGRDAATSQLELQPFLEFLASYSTSRRAAATVIDDVLVVVGESGLRCPPDVIHCEPYAVVSQELHSLEASTAEHSTGLAALREFFEGRSVESVVLSYPPTEATHVVLKTLEAAMEWFSSQPPQNDDALKPNGTSHHGDDEWTMDRALNLFLAAARAVKHNNPLPVSAPLDAAFTDLEQRHQRVQVLTAAVGELKRIREGHGSKADFRTKTVVAWATKAASILSGVLGRERRQMTLTYMAQLAEYRRALQREWSVILRPLGKLRRIDWIESVTTTGDVPCEVLVHAYCQQLLKDWIDEPKYAGLADAGALQRPPVDLSDVSIYLSSPLSFVGALYFHSGIVLTSTAMVPWLPPVDIDPRVPKRALEDGAPTVVYQHVKADALQSAIRRFQRSYLSAAADQNE